MTKTETKEERKRTRTTKQYPVIAQNTPTSAEKSPGNEVENTPRILFLGTKPFVIFTDA